MHVGPPLSFTRSPLINHEPYNQNEALIRRIIELDKRITTLQNKSVRKHKFMHCRESKNVMGDWLQEADYKRLTTGGWLQEADYRRQTTGGRLQEADYKRLTTGGWLQEADYKRLTTRGWLQEADYKRLTTRCWLQEADYRRLTTRGWLQEADYKRLTTGGWLQECKRILLLFLEPWKHDNLSSCQVIVLKHFSSTYYSILKIKFEFW
jgi:hypothetical protein